MSCQSAPGLGYPGTPSSHWKQGRTEIWHLARKGAPRDAPGTFFIGFFEFGQGHRGHMIPYCPGAP
ncbi:unnamed protein product, partial [Staurois parvus]